MNNMNGFFLLLFGFILGCANNTSTVSSSNDGTRKVGQVVWHKQEMSDAQKIASQTIPAGQARVFFLRALDKDGVQTSANVAINGRFQVSLQPGHFSHAYTCAGANNVSVDITGYKHNDLTRRLVSYDLQAGKNYYFGVDVTSKGVILKRLKDDFSLKIMQKMTRQSHQMSRVASHCVAVPKKAMVEPQKEPSKQTKKTPKQLVQKEAKKRVQRVTKKALKK